LTKEWTPARLKSFIISGLRAASSRYPPKFEAKKAAFTEKKINKKTGRECSHYICADCKQEYPSGEVAVDHRVPVVDPKTGFTTWDDFVTRLFCSVDNFQILCETCHQRKTNEEKKIAKEHKRAIEL
jgi:5-methylcytosine-specific restriction endonuclease McrA